MSLMIKALEAFWNGFVKKSDAKVHAKQTEPEGIERVYDIPYLDDGHVHHQLDVYYPEKHDGNLPVIIDVHGGGWMYGDKELNRMYCLNLAKRGFTVFDISYRLVPEVTVNEQIQDVMHALKWIQENMHSYPCTDEIMLTGDSAGGMLAAFTASMLTSEKLRYVFKTVNPEMKLDCMLLTSPVSYMIDSVGMIGVYSRKILEEYCDKSTFDYMNIDRLLPYAELPPTFMITSSGDGFGLKQTRRAAADFRKHGIEVKLVDLPKFEGENLPHVFSILEPESKAGKMVIDDAIGFYRSIIKSKINT